MKDFRRLRMVFQYGWKDAAVISQETGRNRIGIFMDIISCFQKYFVYSNQYRKEKLYSIQGEERKNICLKLQKENTKRVQWLDEFYENYKFLNKWSSLKYEQSAGSQKKRWAAYTKRYGFGKNCVIGHDVLLVRHHNLDGTISVGNDVLIAKHTFIDYSGELIIHDNVKISNGVVIETHRHEFVPGAKKQKIIPTKLVLEEGVWVGQKTIICEEVKCIGRFAQIGAGAVVRNYVPPYAIIVGNPAKIVGFLYTPKEVYEFEKDKYSEEKKTDMEKYTKLYEKYFINRIQEIKKSLNN